MAGREETVDDEELLEFLADADDPFVTTNEVADHFGFSNPGIRKRLYALADDGLINFKRIGRNPGWWITDLGEQVVAGEVNIDDLEDDS